MSTNINVRCDPISGECVKVNPDNPRSTVLYRPNGTCTNPLGQTVRNYTCTVDGICPYDARPCINNNLL
ncbi:hypothetical protein BQ9231_00194 [Cedratvirus lausannensis]|uniref:Uncharacterized protein n=2 Tax=Pithoviruses TaxID=2023203 RepID=A0A285PXW8_9VIRU|nr:hypothetical protein Cbor_426 [Cedratvirus borely]WIL03653.1 hypothetical protein Cplu_422 [Cedratvirus plubellavi]SOB74077.1 hypothetical protein BQ9231_00194 [Cedratvirus lausannensis]SPN79697.1 Hypothetical protein ZAZAV_443 [Cedratvirus Zaza IHUMI]